MAFCGVVKCFFLLCFGVSFFGRDLACLLAASVRKDVGRVLGEKGCNMKHIVQAVAQRDGRFVGGVLCWFSASRCEVCW